MFCYILVAYVALVIGDASSTSGKMIQCLKTPDTSDKRVKGNWSDIRFCEEKSFVMAVQLNHKPFKDGDTAFKSLKGIKLYCDNGDNEQSRVDEFLSFTTEDKPEDWRDKKPCQNGGYIKGFRARSDGNNGLTGLQLFCEGSDDPIGGSTGLGNFLGEEIQYCAAGMAIKGIRARLDKETAKRSTDLTDVEIYCVSTAYTGTVESLLSENWDPCDPLPSPGSSRSDGNPENTENNNLQDSNHATTTPGDIPDSSSTYIIAGLISSVLILMALLLLAVTLIVRMKKKNRGQPNIPLVHLPAGGGDGPLGEVPDGGNIADLVQDNQHAEDLPPGERAPGIFGNLIQPQEGHYLEAIIPESIYEEAGVSNIYYNTHPNAILLRDMRANQ